MKLYKESCKKDVLKFSFGNRVVNSWNKLPEQVVNCESINSFKSNIDKFLRKKWGDAMSSTLPPSHCQLRLAIRYIRYIRYIHGSGSVKTKRSINQRQR